MSTRLPRTSKVDVPTEWWAVNAMPASPWDPTRFPRIVAEIGTSTYAPIPASAVRCSSVTS